MHTEEIFDSRESLHNEPLSPKIIKRTGRTPKKTPSKGDRFIPTRSAMDLELSHFHLHKENQDPNHDEDSEYSQQLADSLFNGKLNKEAKVLAFKSKAPAPADGHLNRNRVLYSSNTNAQPKKVHIANDFQTHLQSSIRHISDKPIKVLDAPNFCDDYYLNLIDWSATNVVAVGLGSSVFTFDASTGVASNLMTAQDESNNVTSVSWTNEGRHVAIGFNSGIVELWDAENQRLMNMYRSNEGRRVGALSWNKYILSTGSRSGAIHNLDVRQRNALVSVMNGHSQEICGLKWSPDGTQLASGGNDNLVNIWDLSEANPKLTMADHQAAVKALAWCPWQRDLLATGGGSADRTIKFWNSTTGACLNSIDTGSQVSQLCWSKASGCKELVSSHGFAQNQLIVWKYPSLVQVSQLTGHSQRILSMSQSPDGTHVITGAADETLCFWNIFPDSKEMKTVKKPTSQARTSSLSSMKIR